MTKAEIQELKDRIQTYQDTIDYQNNEILRLESEIFDLHLQLQEKDLK